MVIGIGTSPQGRYVDSGQVSPGRRSTERRGDACGYASRRSATTPACGRGAIKRVVLVVVMVKWYATALPATTWMI
jgi:hypothetical protein